jgi:acyl carrier protein
VATLGELFGIEAEEVGPATTLEEDLALDSLSVVELQMALEEAYGVRITTDDPSAVVSVADLQAVVDDAVARGEPALPSLNLSDDGQRNDS